VHIAIGKILFIHVLCLLALLGAVLLFSNQPANALWVGVGGLIGLSGVVAQAAFFKLFGSNQASITRLLMWSECCKIVVVVVLFSLLFIFVPKVNALWVFLGFGMTIVSSLVSLLF
jgi:hypothetical protein